MVTTTAPVGKGRAVLLGGYNGAEARGEDGMEVHLRKVGERLEGLTGAVVVIDVFRAGNTLIALLEAGAERVYLLPRREQARRLKAAHPHWLLLGERGGLPPAGFEGGNSPAAAAGMRLAGRRVILTTSAGTQAVHRLRRARPVLFATFANAGAVVDLLRRLEPAAVHLLPMGLEARRPAEEDELAAGYLRLALLAQPPVFAALRDKLLRCPGAERLRRLGQQDDLAWCTRLDVSRLVPVVEWDETEATPFARPWQA